MTLTAVDLVVIAAMLLPLYATIARWWWEWRHPHLAGESRSKRYERDCQADAAWVARKAENDARAKRGVQALLTPVARRLLGGIIDALPEANPRPSPKLVPAPPDDAA